LVNACCRDLSPRTRLSIRANSSRIDLLHPYT
jgi:hypothetical protein